MPWDPRRRAAGSLPKSVTPTRSKEGCHRPVMGRRRMMMIAGFGALAVVMPAPKAGAAPVASSGGYLFHDEFDGPAGSAPDRSKWVISNHRTPIRGPVGFDRPEFFGDYRDSRLLERSGDRHRELERSHPSMAVQRSRLHDVCGLEPCGWWFGWRRPRIGGLPGGNADRLGACLLKTA